MLTAVNRRTTHP